MNTKTKHVAVLYGGLSSEREVSLSSGKAIIAAIEQLGYKVTPIDVGHDVAEKLLAAKPDVAFNALHGTYGEDGCIQGVLEFLQIPYTHSGVLASAVAMHKETAKKIFAANGIRCPKGKLIETKTLATAEPMKRPYVVKPVDDGSSVGVYVFRENDNYFFNHDNLPKYSEMLVEEYIPGRELSVAVIGDKAAGAIEIKTTKEFYDYTAKYTKGHTEYLVPAPVTPAIYQRAMAMAEAAHKALGCRYVSRADIRFDDSKKDDDALFLLEVNTHPGMTPFSLVPKIAAHIGMDFPTLIQNLITSASLSHAG